MPEIYTDSAIPDRETLAAVVPKGCPFYAQNGKMAVYLVPKIE